MCTMGKKQWWNHHVKGNKSDWDRQISHVLSHMQNLGLKKKKEWHKCKIRALLWKGPVKGKRVKGEVKEWCEYYWSAYEVLENRTMKPLKFFKREEGK
jgi:hypothetical protein